MPVIMHLSVACVFVCATANLSQFFVCLSGAFCQACDPVDCAWGQVKGRHTVLLGLGLEGNTEQDHGQILILSGRPDTPVSPTLSHCLHCWNELAIPVGLGTAVCRAENTLSSSRGRKRGNESDIVGEMKADRQTDGRLFATHYKHMKQKTSRGITENTTAFPGHKQCHINKTFVLAHKNSPPLWLWNSLETPVCTSALN